MISTHYSSDSDAIIAVSSEAENSYNLEAISTTLYSQKHSELIRFEASGPVDNVQVFISSDANMSFDSIDIYRTYDMEKRFFIILLFLFIFADILVFNPKWVINNRIPLCTVLVISFIASLPLFSYGTEVGHDLDFHLMRIEGISQELIAGHFPVRMQSYYNYGHGYPVSIYYGDILLYLPALLHVFGFTLIQAYKIYAFAINLSTAALCYFAGRRFWINKNIALFFSAAYTLSTYRFVDIYVRNAVGEYTAMMFFPLIALGIYELYFASTENNYLINVRSLIYISLGMTGVISCHVLSTEMVCIFLLVFAVIFVKKTISKTVIATIATSILTTALLSAYFIIPFIDYYLTVPVKINNTNNTIAHIQSDGAYLLQYFAFFKSVFGARSELVTERLSVTPGLLLMAGLCVAIALIVINKASRTIKHLTLSIIVIMFISSNLFPWDYISFSKAGNFLAQIQFPWRWLMFACLLLSLLLGYILDDIEKNDDCSANYKHIIYIIFAVLLVIQFSSDISSYSTDAINIKAPKYSTDLNGTDYREYYRSDSDFFSLTFEVSGDNVLSGNLVEQNGTDYTFKISVEDGGIVTLPILNYKGFKVWDEEDNYYEIKDGEQKEITIELNKGFDGLLYVSFQEPTLWRIAEIISLITAILLVLMCRKYEYKH